MKALIVGGSLGGLMSGIELRAAGVAVFIHERSDGVLDDRGAGIVMQPETQGILGRCGINESQAGVCLRFRQYLGRDGSTEFHQAMPQLMYVVGSSLPGIPKCVSRVGLSSGKRPSRV